MPGANLSTVQKVLLMLALVGLGALVLQTRPGQPVISAWQRPAGAQQASSGAISGAAAPQTNSAPFQAAGQPWGNPLHSNRIILTQGYGVGSHAPADVWGGVDLALDGDGDGQADPRGTDGAPVYATIDGRASVRPNTYPAGNYLAIEGPGYKVAYAHLSRYAVDDGQTVKRGDVIGYVGATGQASGPHLHYEVWIDGRNLNPLDFGVLDPDD
jgi:murein DD-endopeptidase MepM/ murein hydrolase activator NlpD